MGSRYSELLRKLKFYKNRKVSNVMKREIIKLLNQIEDKRLLHIVECFIRGIIHDKN